MKHFCVLMTLVLGHVLAVTEIVYKMHVYKTNYMLGEIRQGQVDELVQSYVCSGVEISTLALLLAAPENARINANRHYRQDVVDKEQTLQIRISDYAMLNPIFPIIDFNDIALSDMGDTRRNITEAALRRLLVEVESDPEIPKFDVQDTCRLIALFVTANDPTKRLAYCLAVVLDDYRDCHLFDESEHIFKYRKFRDGYYEVSGINNRPGDKLT
ncbi:uncharacterized protein LOC126836381 isoform X1 [Adelges cooleyi]|uniref:uncharacterized protein LOC126836381 isoform X1 n=1 Tax=Adelges cooleyi TaxID=133065 RepID=UPI00217FB284|nr:uncharacterized protein LOC126836381 isoform X1 [Adelges cooleyi]